MKIARKRAAIIMLSIAGLGAATWIALKKNPTAAQIEACRLVLARETDDSVAVWRARAQGTEPPDVDRKIRSLAACAPTYSVPACREAMVRFDEGDPSGRLVRLATACRDAYCPVLPLKPRLCTESFGAPSDLAKMWAEMDRAIVVHDLGSRAAPILAERERRDRELSAVFAAYMDAGSPAWEGTHGTSIRMVPKEALSAPVRDRLAQ